MPSVSHQLLVQMHRAGYVSTAEAVVLSGHPLSTIYYWITEGNLRATRSGTMHFIERKSLEEKCPHVRGAVL